MGVPLIQQYRVGKYLLEQRLAGNRRCPLVLILEPRFQCNLACAGCGWIGYPRHIPMTDIDWSGCGVGRNPNSGNCTAHYGYQGADVGDTFSHPPKRPGIRMGEPRVEDAFAPELAATDTR